MKKVDCIAIKTTLRITLISIFCIIVYLCISPAASAEGDCFTIPKDTTAIGDEAFSNCTEMTSVVIPVTVKSIGRSAFSGCTNLKRIYFDGTQTQWYNISIAADNEPLMISRCVFLAEKPTITSVEVNGNRYIASFLGRMDMSSWNETYSCRDYWRLENAYDDFKDCRITWSSLPEDNYPMSIEAGQVYVIDYTLKNGDIQRQLMRCDGNEWNGMLITQELLVPNMPPIRTETMTIGGKDYTASYYGRQNISSVSEFVCRDFWRLENAYDDFKNHRLVGESLPQSNYPMEIEKGQVFVIDYTMKEGGVSRKLMRCDGDTWENQLTTHAFSTGEPIRTEIMAINGKQYTASYFGAQEAPNWSEYQRRDFWRLENAYDDFKNCRLVGERLPQSNYPMEIEKGQVFVIDYTLKEGGVIRMLMRCDGDTWENQLTTVAFSIN